MNQNLKTIHDLLQQNKNLAEADKAALLKAITDADKQWSVTDFKLDRTEKVKKTTAILLEETIQELEQKRRAVEAQNQELAIESSLERVRTVAMSMMKPGDLLNICKAQFIEFKQLGFEEIRNSLIGIFQDENNSLMDYDYSDFAGGSIHRIPYHKNRVVDRAIQQMKSATDAFTEFVVEGKELEEWKAFRKQNGEYDDARIANCPALYYYFYSVNNGNVGISTFKQISSDQLGILKRFRNVFDLAYKRYIDISNAEEQARESQIQLAMERVRARTMAMQKSDELAEVSSLIFQQLKSLGVSTYSSGFTIWDDTNGDLISWMCNADGSMNPPFTMPIAGDAWHTSQYESWKKGEDFILNDFVGEQMESYFRYLRSFPLLDEAFDKSIAAGHPMPQRQVHHVANFSHGNLLFITLEPNAEAHEIFKRFAKVFEQTYTRFLDLKKAEAQAREAQIQLALERVRARTMAMQKSDELVETAVVLFDQLKQLGEHIERTIIGLVNEEEQVVEFWATRPGGSQIGKMQKFPLDEPIVMQKVYGAWRQQKKSIVIDLRGEELENYFQLLKARGAQLKREDFGERRVENFSFFSHGWLGIISADSTKPADVGLYERFAAVFDQTYMRFLDLQKAEAQAKEAQIEAALERVRSRTMAMQKSEDLKEVIQVVYEQFVHLKVNTEHTGFVMDYKVREDRLIWVASKHGVPSQLTIPYFDSVYYNSFNKAKEKGWDFFATNLSFEEKNKFYEQLFTHIPGLPEDAKEFYFTCPGLAISTVLLENVALYIENFEGIPYSEEDNAILMRFGKVFQQTYTRFLDLQKAEAQARESQIELGLERVRAKAMAMQKSEELGDIVAILFEELTRLDLILARCILWMFDQETTSARLWMANSEDRKTADSYYVGPIDHPYFEAIVKGWQRREATWVYHLKGEEKKSIDEILLNKTELSRLPQMVKDGILSAHHTIVSGSFNNFGLLEASGPVELVAEQMDILSRFAKAFDLTYTRFNDLKLAEAQAHKARIEAALERVRARALAMQQPEELKDVATVLRQEMGLLGVEELETCSIYINDASAEKAECWYALKDVRGDEKRLVNDHFTLDLTDTWVGREMLKFYNSGDLQTSIVMTGKNRIEWIRYCEERSVPLRRYYGEVIPDRTYHLYKFSHGAIGAASVSDISEESWTLLARTASVFSLAYSRFKDLTKARSDLIQLKEEKKRAEDALTELQITQKQLIQSEKMASLGELTAGIAHEIQNPLNFVNNFSDVSSELLDEMTIELEKGNKEDAIAIAEDVKQNLGKILHHGKRADEIVKGMLQHSRTGSGLKEPTDINALCDEYLRLAYHGLRAKDNAFNAKTQTDFDSRIGKINVVPQEIGRVILNLITNAFYAVDEKKRKCGSGYEPTIALATKLVIPPLGGTRGAEIIVSDNGNGIPQKVLDKIFQPFFTTKPAGQGTGLGLSLAYDIVKAHGGEIKVETRENEGTAFRIVLPCG